MVPDQTQHNVVSNQDLPCLLTECSIKNLIKKRKIPPITLNIGDGLVLLIRVGKSIGLKWVKRLIDLLITSDMSSN